MKRPIAIGLAPNEEKKDAFAALRVIWMSWKYTKGDGTKKLESWFANYFDSSYAFAFVSARGALTALLKSKGIGKGDEVLMQAYTCVAVSNAIIATGASPVYVDITQSTFGMDAKDLEKKITTKTKAVILQHTFGIPAFSQEVDAVLRQHHLFVIEDAAHAIGTVYNGKKIGTIGDAAIFSFGRDKAFSCVSGGMVITKDLNLGKKLASYHEQQNYPSSFWTFQQLFHSISFFFLILPLYNVFLGKVLLVLFQKLHLLSKPVDPEELQHFHNYTKKLPPVLSALALLQLERIDKFNTHREEIASYYSWELREIGAKKYTAIPLLRFPFLVRNASQVKRFAKKAGVYLGDWYSNVIDPKGTSLSAVGYMHDCPTAEYIASHSLNLPTYPTLPRKDAEKVVKIIKAYGKSESNY